MKDRNILISIASSNQLEIGREVKRIKADVSAHLDVEDGCFVPNITFGIKTIRAIAEICAAPLDAHLLVLHPEDYVEPLAACNVKKVAFHIEPVSYPLVLLNQIKHLGMRAGIALNFVTPLQTLEMFIQDTDYILLMTSEPDGCGQLFNSRSFERVRRVREMLGDDKRIFVDGGITANVVPDLVKAGATDIVVGREIFESNNPGEKIKHLKKLLL